MSHEGENTRSIPLASGGNGKQQLPKWDILKSAAPDNLYPRVFKELAEELAGPLMVIICKSWTLGKFQKTGRKLMLCQYFKKVNGMNWLIRGLSVWHGSLAQ